MKVDHIIENGYDKLANYLHDGDKGFLDGIKFAIEMIENYMNNEYDLSECESTLDKIDCESGRNALEGLIDDLTHQHGMCLISFVEHNDDYELDEYNRVVRVSDGKVMDDEESGNKERCGEGNGKPCTDGDCEGDC